MSDKKIILPPTKFVGLHAHSLSLGDSIGLPKEHMDFAIENGMDALALTDHGHMNGFSHQYLYAKELAKKGVPFKALPGMEAYYVNSLSNWKRLYDDDRAQKAQVKLDKAAAAKKKTPQLDELALEALSDQFADVKEELDELTTGGNVVEDEDESKKRSWMNPINKRNHLVLLPKNQEGLYALFRMASLSYSEGFYRYPRIDLNMLRKYAKGNIIASTACVAGPLAAIIFGHQDTEQGWDAWSPSEHKFEAIQKELAAQIEQFQDALGKENFYCELQFNKLLPQHLVNQHLIEASKRTGAPLVVTCDSHYSRPEHWREREIYKAMAWMNVQKGTFDKDKLPQHIADLKCELYPKNAEQVWNTYKETTEGNGWDFYDDQLVKDAIERTHSIAHDQIGDALKPNTSVKLPSLKRIVGQEHYTSLMDKIDIFKEREDLEHDLAFAELKAQAIKGLMWRKKDSNPEYIERLKEELKVIKHLKFTNYFLTYGKIMSLLGEKMLLGPGRGSAAGSLLSYVLNITQIDPIKHGLLFERFLTRFKTSYPDIDSDISNRDEALASLTEFFGQENIIPVSNFTQLQMRSLIKDVCKLEGVSFEEANEYTKAIETEARNEAKKEPGFDAAQWVLSYEEAHANSPTFRKLMETYPGFKNTIKVLFKEFRGVSRHAGGVIITEDAFGNMPVIKSGGVLQTPWPEGLNYRHLEELGFLKFDILGLGTLRMIEDTIRKILKKKGHKYVTFEMVKQWYYDNLHPDNNAMDDINVYKQVYWEGNYAGVFQFVNPPVQRFVAQMKPRCINDISVATSLFRPGPLSIGADQNYLENRQNPKSIRYLHPLLEECLSDTAGLIVYQEQLQLIYHKLAGVPLEETDNIRKAFTKKEVANRDAAAEYRNKLRDEFATRCLAVNDIDQKTCYAIFDDMEQYVKYSFNKSHAISYATVSYQSAWLLHYYPDEWIPTYVDYSTTEKGKIVGKTDPKVVALAEAQALGYRVGKVDINFSERDFSVVNKTLIPSFASVQYCGKSVTEEIFANRPYKTLEDLAYDSGGNWKHTRFNKRALGTLIKIGAFESMGLVGENCTFKNYKQMYHVLVDNGDAIKRSCGRKKNRDYKEVLEKLVEESQSIADWTLREKIEFSKEITGSVDISLVITPDISEFLAKQRIKSIDDWEHENEMMWAVVVSSAPTKTKLGKDYLKATIHGASGESHTLYCWGFNKAKGDQVIPPHTMVLGQFEKSDFGFSCFYSRLESLYQKEPS